MIQDVTFLDRTSSFAPVVVTYNAVLVMLWVGTGGGMMSSVYNPALGWSAPEAVAAMASAPAASAPALAVFRARLCAVWAGIDGALYSSTCGPDMDWTSAVALEGRPVAGLSPALTATENRLISRSPRPARARMRTSP